MGGFLEDFEFPTFLELFAQMDILKECDSVLESFAKELFKNLAFHIRKRKNLKATAKFIGALANYPGIGLIVHNYANSPLNEGIAGGS
jgi:hypothetical protein